jgi:hypothetical protein
MSETSKPASCVKENLPDYVSDSSLPTYLFLHTTLSQDVGSLAVGNPRKTISEPLVILAVSIREAGTPTVREVSAVQAQVSLCTQYAYHAEAGYEILNNLWGKDTATSGSQCTYFDGTAGSGIKWSTQWTWAGGQDNVKSYAYAERILDKGRIVSQIKNMPTNITWRYDTNNMRCHFAYDV